MRSVTGILLSFILLLTSPLVSLANEPDTDQYRLLLFLVIDQGGYETVMRYRKLYSGGLKRLIEQGTSFTQMHHRHAVTVTASGHASITTGMHPANSGMVDNSWFDRNRSEEVYCVADSIYGVSPKNLLVTTLGDWAKKTDYRSKVFAISGKDRSAVILGGKKADGAFWYDKKTGRFVTSQYYGSKAKRLLKIFDVGVLTNDLFDKEWSLLTYNRIKLLKAGATPVDYGDFQDDFPKSIGPTVTAPSSSFYRALAETPFIDQLTAQFAGFIIDKEQLGQDPFLDILFISFSAVDTVGHRYGPDSLEVADTLLRLDWLLGGLFKVLDHSVGLEHIVISLTGDHGVHPFPEARHRQGLEGTREPIKDRLCIQNLERKLELKFLSDGQGNHMQIAPGYLNLDYLEKHGISVDNVMESIKFEIEKCDSVSKVWIANKLSGDDSLARSYKNSWNPQRSPDFYIQRKEFQLELPFSGTTHSSPYAYDTHVPWLVLNHSAPHKIVDQPTSTVDIAPTLSQILGISTPGKLDGQDISHLFPHSN